MAEPGSLNLAWQRVKRDQGDDLVCGDFVFEGLKHQRASVLAEIDSQLQAGGRYAPGPVAHLRAPKSALTTRPGCALTPLDRIVYHWLVDKLYPVLEPHFPPRDERVVMSYRYCGNPGSDAPVGGSHKAFKEASREMAQKGQWVVSTDLTRYFERIDHGVLVRTLESLGAAPDATGPLLGLVSSWVPGLACGLPQSQDPSGYLATALLVGFDKSAMTRSSAYCRYTDDMVAVVPSREEAVRWLATTEKQLWEMGLALNCHKTRVESAEQHLSAKSDHQIALERHLDSEKAWLVAANAYGSGGEDDAEMDAILAMVDDHDAFLSLFQEEVLAVHPSVESLRPCLREFARLNPAGALDNVLPSLDACLTVGRSLEQYLLAVLDDDPGLRAPIADALVAQLSRRDELSDWQAMWALHCCYRLPVVQDQLLDVVGRYVSESRRWAEPVAAHAMLLAGWDGSDETRLTMLGHAERDGRPWVAFGAIAGVQELNKRDRNSFLGRAGRADVLADILGGCVKQGAFEEALAARRSTSASD